MRRKFAWTANQLDKLNKVKTILTELEKYKPLTLRQVFYQLVGKGYIPNTKGQYTMLSGLIKWARIQNKIPWDDIEDRSRVFNDSRGWAETKDFMRWRLSNFIGAYTRDLMQTQKKYIEVWIEKDALSSIFSMICEQYTIPVVACKGFASISSLNDLKNRIESEPTKDHIMLYFGDFDPSGVEMLTAMKTTLEQELGVYHHIEFKRIGLLKEDIYKYKLPHNPDALKKTDSRAMKHIKAYGDLAVELDALSPDVLEQKIRTAIENELDVEAFNEEVEKYNEDKANLQVIKQEVVALVAKLYT
jgi:hypothetical protein